MSKSIDFKPKISLEELSGLEKDIFQIPQIKNNDVYSLVKELTEKAEPNLIYPKDEKRWIDFYLPVKEDEKLICIPFAIINYRGEFFIHSKEFRFSVMPDNQKSDEIYKNIFTETIRFLPEIKNNPKILEKLVPYRYRTGKIKGKYVMKNLLPPEVAKRLLKKYKKHIKKNLKVEKVSLNDYLKVAGICIKAIFPEENKLSDLELYERHADFRHGGMLEIKDKNSPEEFKNWYLSKEWVGSHPFEIVATYRKYGIILRPPIEDPYYTISLGRMDFGKYFIKAVEALIDQEVPFRAPMLKKVLEYLQGESYFEVNGVLPEVFCDSEEDEIFKYVEWNPLKLPKLKI